MGEGKKKKRKPSDIFINNEIITLYRAAEKKILGKNKKATSTSTISLNSHNYCSQILSPVVIGISSNPV